MTSELAILNRHGIALAADSAVTIGGLGQTKVYNSVNKLFALSRRAPVGIMIFGNADLTGVPWETIVKVYRRRLGDQAFDRLEDYADDFLRFLNRRNVLFPEEQQTTEFVGSLLGFYYWILRSIDNEINERLNTGPLTLREISGITTRRISDVLADWERAEFLAQRTETYAERVTRKWRTQITESIERVFQKVPLGPTTKRRLIRLAGLLFAKQMFPDLTSGVVIAGFGESEHYPSLVGYEIEGVVLDRVKYRVGIQHKSQAADDAMIMPFAQREMVDLFMSGIDPSFSTMIGRALQDFVAGLPDAMVDPLSMDDRVKARAKRQIRRSSETLLRAFHDQLERHSDERHVQPIVESVALLPKEELAAMAESLVHLTSLKRRITMDVETVGGPIDVAVISKGDGFIWIKRKHYFDPALNHQFFANYNR